MANKNYVDKTGLLYVITKIKALLAGKVDAVEGKGLSSNDYTSAEKTKLSGIAEGANNYIHPSAAGNRHIPEGGAAGQILRWHADGEAEWGADQDTTYSPATAAANGLMSSADKVKLNGIAEGANKTTVDAALSSTSMNPVQNKAVNAALAAKAPLASPTFTGVPKVPTAAAGTNSTQIATTAFVVSAVSEAVADITSFGFEVVSALPAAGVKGIIYLMSNSGSGNNVYDEHIWVNGKFEKIGTTAVDLSGYMLTADLVAITTSEIDAMFA